MQPKTRLCPLVNSECVKKVRKVRKEATGGPRMKYLFTFSGLAKLFSHHNETEMCTIVKWKTPRGCWLVTSQSDKRTLPWNLIAWPPRKRSKNSEWLYRFVAIFKKINQLWLLISWQNQFTTVLRVLCYERRKKKYLICRKSQVKRGFPLQPMLSGHSESTERKKAFQCVLTANDQNISYCWFAGRSVADTVPQEHN